MSGVCGSFGAAAGAATRSAGRSAPLLAADYFGTANPINFWTSDLSGAAAAFDKMKESGFNAVGLVVPWGYFEPSLTPPRFNQGAFKRLNSLVSTAERDGMQVILRLSYDWDLYPKDQLPGAKRITAAFAHRRFFADWLGYIGKLAVDLAPYPNVAAHYLSWEDLWFPVTEASHVSALRDRIRLATTTGYRTWLKAHYSLVQMDRLYRARFLRWSDVPTPIKSRPSFDLMFHYDSSMVTSRFFAQAEAAYPGLTMESRVDVDPIYRGRQVVGSVSYGSMFKLAGTTSTGVYFSPYMADPARARQESVAEALAGLETTLSSIRAASGGRSLYLYEFEITDNNPPTLRHPHLSDEVLGQFLQQSAPVLARETTGYGLWTYRDYHLSAVVNPSFSLGSLGWRLGERTRVEDAPGQMSFLTMGQGGTADQVVHIASVQTTPHAPFELSLAAAAPGRRTTISVSVGDGDPRTIVASGGWRTYQMRFRSGEPPSSRVTITAGGPVSVREVQLFNFTQHGGIRTATGAAERALGSLEQLNREMTTGSPDHPVAVTRAS